MRACNACVRDACLPLDLDFQGLQMICRAGKATYYSSKKSVGKSRPQGYNPRVLIIALKNLLHDKTQFAVAVLGVSFSVILMAGQIGVFLGFMDNCALMIDNTDADIWITSKNSRNFDFSQPLPERKLNLALRVKAVPSSEKMVFGGARIRTPDAGSEQVVVVGCKPDTRIDCPGGRREGSA